MSDRATEQRTSGKASDGEGPWASSRPLVGGLLLLVASIQFIVAMIVEQALRPGYSDFGNTISDLGVNNPALGWSYDWIFDGSIILLGIMAILAILILLPCFPRGILAHLGEIFLIIGSAGAIGVGIFTESYPWHAYGLSAHDYASAVTFLFANVGMTLFGPTLRRHKVFDRYWGITTFLGVFSTVAVLFYFYFILGPGGFFGLGEGGLERFVAFPVLIWAIVVGWVTFQRWQALRTSPAPKAPVESPA